MGLELLYGPPGSGKTRLVLEAARARAMGEGLQTWLVVPDQASFLMEKRVLEQLGERDGRHVRVFSFSRLSRYVLSETGGVVRPFLDASGKGVLVYRVISALQEQLPMFADAIRKGGFPAVAGALLTEFKRYGVTPSEMVQVAELLHETGLAAKLRELAAMGTACEAAMLERGYLDAEDRLSMAAERLGSWPSLGAVHLCLCRFMRISPVQLQLVQAFLRHGSGVTFALPLFGSLEEAVPQETDLPGKPARASAETLARMAVEKGIKVIRTCTTGIGMRHATDSGLFWLGRHLSRLQQQPFDRVPADIRMARFEYPEQEIHACARQLVALCRHGDFKFRDLAVLAPDTAEYAASIRRIFRMHEIPFFMDRKESLAGNPVSVALLAVFDVLRGDWRHDDVFRLLKTGLLPVQAEVVDQLENHALRTGLRGGKRWKHFSLDDMAMEQARLALVEPLTTFREVVRGKVPVSLALNAYLDLLLSWQLPQMISTRAGELEAAGRLAPAAHLRQIWQSACELMDQILELSGDLGALTLKDMHGMLQSGLESGTTGIIPPSLDEVFVGTPSRSQMGSVRHLFVLGACEGWIPAAPGGQGLLTDAERRQLSHHGMSLAPDVRAASRERRDELDAVLTAPDEVLWLGFPASDSEGRVLQPSVLVQDMRAWFSSMPVGQGDWLPTQEGEYPEINQVTTPRATLETLVPGLGTKEMEGFSFSLMRLCFSRPGMASLGEMVRMGLRWENQATLSPDWIRARYGVQLAGSISSMEQYRRCPFSWFARHACRLRERDVVGLRDVGFGLLMHDILDHVMAAAEREGDWESQTETHVPGWVHAAVETGLEKGSGISPLHPGLRSWYASRLEKAAVTAVERVFHHIRAGGFRPLGHELVFGSGGPFPAYEIALSDGGLMRLQGRLDRLDIYEDDMGRYVRVVDYKSGDRGLSLAEIANGLSLQLPAYLAVALSSMRVARPNQPVHPAGIFHMRLEPPDIRMDSSDVAAVGRERNRRMRLGGWVLDDPRVLAAMDAQFASGGDSDVLKASVNRDGTISARTKTLSEKGFERLSALVSEKIGEQGVRLKQGQIPVRPLRMKSGKACDMCVYQRVCRFEPGVGGVSFDRLGIRDEESVRSMLEGEVVSSVRTMGEDT